MKRTNNELTVLKLRQLEKNPSLVNAIPSNRYKRIKESIQDFGQIYPIIVAKTDSNALYNTIKGHVIVEISDQLGIGEVNSIIIDNLDLAQQRLLSLKMSLFNDNIGPIDQGALIEDLLTNHNMTMTKLSKFIDKSSSWISKRLSLKNKLSPTIHDLIRDNSIAPRTAEELTKLPKEEQDRFAANIVGSGLSKDIVTKLVSLYNDPNTDNELKNKIINDPLNIKLLDYEKPKKEITYNNTDEISKTIFKCRFNIEQLIDLINQDLDIKIFEQKIKQIIKLANTLIEIINTKCENHD